jgi:hypothetical protein
VTGQLSEDLSARRVAVAAALERAERALRRESYEQAVDQLLEVRRLQPGNARLAELAEQVTEAVVAQTRRWIEQGRLDLAASLLEHLRPLVGEHLATSELHRVLEQCGAATSWLEKGSVHQALRSLYQLRQLLPEADWIQQAIEATERASSSLDAVRGGPLGLLVADGSRGGRDMQTHAAAGHGRPGSGELSRLPGRAALGAVGSAPLPDRWLVQVDGAGSVVVVRARVTTIGPVSSTRAPLVGLLAPADLPTIAIERLEDDYFLRCDQAVRINGKSVSDKLLCDGDKISLSPRLEIRFLLPNAASTSAVLELTGARLPRQDVRRIILLDESIVLGGSGAAHVRVRGLQEDVVLYVRHERLYGRVGSAAQRNGSASEVVLNRPVHIGPVSLVVTEVPDQRLG